VATFAYNAINAQGLELAGTLTAPDSGAATEQLRLKGLLAHRLDELDGASAHDDSPASGFFKRVKPRSLQIFSRQFATMIEAGMNVVTALVILEQQTTDRILAEVIGRLREDVEGGLLLSEAMARHPRVFGRLYVAMVEAGEAAGILDLVLDRVAMQLEKEQAIKRRVKGAMVYPTIVFAFAVVVLNGMLLFLVPIFSDIFAQLNGQLPLLTQEVVKASDALRSAWFVIFPALGLLVASFFRGKRTERGRRIWDSTRLRFPLQIGPTIRKIVMARFARSLATLVAAGVDIIKAIEITAHTSGNWVIEHALLEAKQRIHEGAPVSQPLVESPVFPPMVSQMIKVGEETGELETMLAKIADFYEEEVDAAVATLTSIIEPVMMIGVGLMVGVIVISMYLPMFKMLSLVNGSGG
jgi:type IV pilus assembly protein PilC